MARKIRVNAIKHNVSNIINIQINSKIKPTVKRSKSRYLEKKVS
jgi:hypothetical protein